jgi:hypothetical protein
MQVKKQHPAITVKTSLILREKLDLWRRAPP